MIVHDVNTYSSGTSSNQSPKASTLTTAQSTQITTQQSVGTPENTSKGWKQWAFDELNDIAKLEPNWDSYDGDPPSPLAIALASTFLERVINAFGSNEHSQPQSISARADGGIQIGWSGFPLDVSVHTGPSDSIGYLFIDRRGDCPIYEEVSHASWDETIQRVANVVFSVPR